MKEILVTIIPMVIAIFPTVITKIPTVGIFLARVGGKELTVHINIVLEFVNCCIIPLFRGRK